MFQEVVITENSVRCGLTCQMVWDWGSHPATRLGHLPYFLMSKAVDDVVVHHADCLHE